MAVSRTERRTWKRLKWKGLQPGLALLALVGVALVAGAIAIAWFASNGYLQPILDAVLALQQYPPLWLEVPMVAWKYLLAPTVILLVVALIVMGISPLPQRWSRAIVVSILLALTLRYLVWRSLSTLNLSSPLNASFSLGLFGLEMLMLSSGVIQLVLMLRFRDRRWAADRYAEAVVTGQFTPTVDVLIPTYNEPPEILRRTVIGCQAMDYPHQRVYLLDDTNRPEVRALATELGCDYLARPDNRYAKAGNLNYAVAHSHGELIVVFDADFVPTRNFLTRTVGFFQNPAVALVQTPQSFYNPDPIARNLGLENILTPEEEVFYRQIQPIRDSAGSVICAGTSFVVRRSALEETGGFFTGSLSEDYFTGIKLSARGYQLIYLDEKLSAGLAAESMADYAVQRLRWARGTLQAFFIEANPLTIPGLTPLQRLAHLEGLLHWFTSLSRVGYLLIPLAFSFLGVIPVVASTAEILYFFLPYYVVQLSVFSWLNYRSRSALLADIYSLVLAFPLALTVIQVMLRPFAKGFQVTPKGTVRDRYSFNWHLALPLLILFILTAISLWLNLGMCMMHGGWGTELAPEWKGLNLGWLWSSYNLLMLGIALLILLDVPNPDPYNWFDLRRTVRLSLRHQEAELVRRQGFPPLTPLAVADAVQPLTGKSALWQPSASDVPPAVSSTFWGMTTMISEGGAEIALTQAGFPPLAPDQTLPVTLEILEEQLTLSAVVTQLETKEELPVVRLLFEPLPLWQQRQLVTMLFCRPGQWKRFNSPGEFQSLLLLLQILLLPRVLFDRKRAVRAIAVAQG